PYVPAFCGAPLGGVSLSSLLVQISSLLPSSVFRSFASLPLPPLLPFLVFVCFLQIVRGYDISAASVSAVGRSIFPESFHGQFPSHSFLYYFCVPFLPNLLQVFHP
ncbi:hypothetical protein B0H10DRAFT_2028653, partial [Mycena sp. CBHHK59/15]